MPDPAFTPECRRRLESLADPDFGARLAAENRQAVRAALAEIDRQALRWSDIRPTEPGAYWYRGGPDDRHPFVLKVYKRPDDKVRTYWYNSIRDVAGLGGQWAGPIPEPIEARPVLHSGIAGDPPAAPGPGEGMGDV